VAVRATIRPLDPIWLVPKLTKRSGAVLTDPPQQTLRLPVAHTAHEDAPPRPRYVIRMEQTGALSV